MQTTKIDGTDLEVSRVAFGTGSMHQIFRRSDRRALLDVAFDCGISHFDTSPYYGFGLAEVELGRFLADKRSRATLASKVGLYAPGRGRGGMVSVWSRKLGGRVVPSLNRVQIDGSLTVAKQSLAESLVRLQTDYLDLLYLHEPDASVLEADEFRRWFEELEASGRIRAWGLAGETDTLRSWTARGEPMARVIQTRDSLEHRQADFVLAAGRPLQFTYGYMSGANAASRESAVYVRALERNSTGAVLMSTRSPARLLEVAAALA